MNLNKEQNEYLANLRARAMKRTIIVIGLFILPFYLIYRCDENDRKKYEAEFHESDIKDETTFKKYISIEAQDFCKRNNEINNMKNSSNQMDESGKLSQQVYFFAGTIDRIGRDNDFSDDVVARCQDYFESELKKCGYYNE